MLGIQTQTFCPAEPQTAILGRQDTLDLSSSQQVSVSTMIHCDPPHFPKAGLEVSKVVVVFVKRKNLKEILQTHGRVEECN